MPRPPSTFSGDVGRICAARHEPVESPIDLCIAEAIPLLLPNLEWMYLNRVPSKLRIANTGRTVILIPAWSSGGPRIRGGPLKSEYVLSQIHFHWGRSDGEGSEHSVEGQRLPLEMHVVGYKAGSESHYRALEDPDGTVVVAFLFVMQERDNPDLSELVSATDRVSAAHSSARHPTFALSRLVPPVRSDYLVYWGVITGRETTHQLLWLVDRKPIGISREQISVFRRIHQNETYVSRTRAASVPPPGAVFYADPSRRPPDTPTLLPLGSDSPTRGSQRITLSARASPQTSQKSSLMSNLFSKSGEKSSEKNTFREDSEIYKAMAWDQSEKPFAEPAAVPVGFSFGCRRAAPKAQEDSQPYLPARNVSFKQISKGRYPSRREAVESNRTGGSSSDSSDSESGRSRYHTARTSTGRRARPVEKRKRGHSSYRATSHSFDSASNGLSAKTTENVSRLGNGSSSDIHSSADAASPPWSNESPSPSVELASSDLTGPGPGPGRPPERRTKPSIINTCGIEDILIETLPPKPESPTTSTYSSKPSRNSRQSSRGSTPLRDHPDVPRWGSRGRAPSSSRGSRGKDPSPSRDCKGPPDPVRSSALPREYPNVQPMMAKSMTGASVAGSFVQEEQARTRDAASAKGSWSWW